MEYEEKELETFPTTYIKDYIWFKNVEKVKIFNPADTFALSEEEKNNYIRKVKFKISPVDIESIKKLYDNRMQTTYEVSYCKEKEKTEEGGTEYSEGTDAIMDEAEKLYSERKQKLLPPLSTARRVLGYCRPSFYYTELSEYQGTYGQLGYNIFKKGEEMGVSRMAPKHDCKNMLKEFSTDTQHSNT